MNCRLFYTISLFLLFVCACGTSSLAEDISVMDMVAGYRNNASQFSGARVAYKTTTHVDMRHLIPSVPSRGDNVLPKMGAIESTFKIDYWTNFDDLLIRGGNELEISKMRELIGREPVSFECVLDDSSEDSLLPVDLETRYREVPIVSYFAQDKTVRHWRGYSIVENSDEKNQNISARFVARAQIGGTIPLLHDANFLFPPFLPFSFENKGSVFPTDAFFEMPLKNLRLLGSIVSGGETYFVLENDEMSELSLDVSRAVVGTKYEGADIRLSNVYRAWVSIKKGCIPVRIEKSFCYNVDGRLIGLEKSLDFRSVPEGEVFEIQKIEEVSRGVFFPTRGSLKFYTATKNSQETHSSVPMSFVDILEKKEPLVPVSMAVYKEQEWEIVRVVPNVDVAERTLKLPFPKDTELFDMQTGNLSIVGMTDAEYEQMLRDEEEQSRMYGVVPDSGAPGSDREQHREPDDFIPRPPRGGGFALFLIGVNLVVLGLILRYILLVRKRRKK